MKKFSTCGIIGFNAPEYFFSLYGCWLMGAVTVGIYTTNAPDACYYVLHHSESEICVCQGGKQAEKIWSIRDRLPHLKAVIVYWPDEGMPTSTEGDRVKLYRWEEWLEIGNAISDEEIIEGAMKVEPGSCATLIYTSGTTGDPKGAMISHDACTFQCQGIQQRIGLQPRDRYVACSCHISCIDFFPSSQSYCCSVCGWYGSCV